VPMYASVRKEQLAAEAAAAASGARRPARGDGRADKDPIA